MSDELREQLSLATHRLYGMVMTLAYPDEFEMPTPIEALRALNAFDEAEKQVRRLEAQEGAGERQTA